MGRCWPTRWGDTDKMRLFIFPLLCGYSQVFCLFVLFHGVAGVSLMNSRALPEMSLCLSVHCLTVELCEGTDTDLLLHHLGDITVEIAFQS